MTDYICQHLQRTSIKDFESKSFSATPEQREFTLLSGLVVAVIERELEILKEEALEGKFFAMEALHRIASQSTTHLALLACRAPDHVRPIAEHESVWPVPYSEAARHKRFATKLVTGIDLGTKLTGPLQPGNVLSEDTLARKLIFTVSRGMERIRTEALKQKQKDEDLAPVKDHMDSIGLRIPPEAIQEAHFQDLQSVAITQDEINNLSLLLRVEQPLKSPHTLGNLISGSARLPELTPDEGTVDAWMEVIKQFLMNVCEGHPETSALRTLGTFQASSTSRSYESSVRVGIWVVLRRALRRIAERGHLPGNAVRQK